MSGYRDRLYARSCDDCQRAEEPHECAGTVWIDGSRVSCACGCRDAAASKMRTEALRGSQRDGPPDTHGRAAGPLAAAKSQALGQIWPNDTNVIRGDE